MVTEISVLVSTNQDIIQTGQYRDRGETKTFGVQGQEFEYQKNTKISGKQIEYAFTTNKTSLFTMESFHNFIQYFALLFSNKKKQVDFLKSKH